MFGLRPYKTSDADTILSWCTDERTFCKWSAGKLGTYPPTKESFEFVKTMMPFTAFDEDGIVGFFILRQPGDNPDELRIGFVIVDPKKRGTGVGKAMMVLAVKYATEIYGVHRITIGVFENNLPAYYCYKAVGFKDVTPKKPEIYHILGEEWKCLELAIEHE